MSTNDHQRGLYRKYELFRVNEDGTPKHLVTDPFFVLRYTTDPHARVALEAYADSCGQEYPQLADDLYRALGMDVAVAPVDDMTDTLAAHLEAHWAGRWVAVRHGHVVASGDSLSEARRRSDGCPDVRTLLYVPMPSEVETR